MQYTLATLQGNSWLSPCEGHTSRAVKSGTAEAGVTMLELPKPTNWSSNLHVV